MRAEKRGLEFEVALQQLRAERVALYRRYLNRVEIREAGLHVIPNAKRFPLEAAFWWAAKLTWPLNADGTRSRCCATCRSTA